MLKDNVLEDIGILFCKIRSHAQQEAILKSYQDVIEEKRTLVNDFGSDLQKSIFTYCFDILKSSIEGQEQELVFDFADAVHNLHEIFCSNSHWGKTPASSLKIFWKLFIQPLRNKHGKHFFDDFKYVFM